MLDVALLGTGGMMPLADRFLTGLLLRLEGRMMLIDCGEGMQVTMRQLGWGFKNIDVICFTHYHADHISGLPGLLLTLGNSDRTEPLTLIGPKGLKEVYKGLRTICPELPYPIVLREFENTGVNRLEQGVFNIKTLKCDHKVSCAAYSIEVRRKGKFDVERARALNLPVRLWSVLQKQGQAEYEGKIYTADMVLGQERRGIKISYCTDTRPVKELPAFIEGSDLFVCEGMYGEDDKLDKAKGYKHMLFSEAAQMAKMGNVKEMWLTHFSPSMPFPNDFIDNARRIFPNTVAGKDRKHRTFDFED